MGKGECGNHDGAIFVENLRFLGVDFVEDDFIGRIGAEVIYLWLEDACEVFRPVDVEVLNASEQSEGGQHSEESEGVVAMQVGEEDGLQMGETEARTAECHLGAFSAIEHEEFFADVDDLRGTESFGGGKSGSASQYGDFELFHLVAFLRVTAAVGKEVAMDAVLFVSALLKGTVLGVFLVGGEDFLDFLGEECIVYLAALFLVIHQLFLLVEFHDARVIVAIVLGAVHQSWNNGTVGNRGLAGGICEHLAVVKGLHDVVVACTFLRVEEFFHILGGLGLAAGLVIDDANTVTRRCVEKVKTVNVTSDCKVDS